MLTKVRRGRQVRHDTHKVSGGLHGVGVTVVNVLSEWLEAEVRRDGQVWQQDYEQGIAKAARPRPGAGQVHGHDHPVPARRDDFSQDAFDYDTLEKRLRELAFLNKRVRIRLSDERGDERKDAEFFRQRKGLGEFVGLPELRPDAAAPAGRFPGPR